MRTSLPSTSGVKRTIGADRECCSFKTTPPAGQCKAPGANISARSLARSP